MTTNVTDAEIEEAFKNSNFGGVDRRKLLEQGVLKRSAGYCCGHTLTMILQKIGLTNMKNKVTRKGVAFMFDAFYDERNSG